MRTLKYSITKILIYTISALLIYFLKTNVFALTCDTDRSVTYDIQQQYIEKTFYFNSSSGWPGGAIWKFEGTSYRDFTIPNGYDYAVVKIPITWAITDTMNSNGQNIDQLMSQPLFNIDFRNTNTNNDGAAFCSYSDGFAYCRFDVSKFGNTVHVRGMGVRYNSFVGNFSSTSLWLYIFRWWDVSYYKCDSNDTVANKIDETNNKLQETQDYLEDDNTSGANGSASGFFNNFNNTDHGGLSGIVSAPMRLVNALSSSSCSALSFPLPFVNEQVTLPCMSPIYSQHFGAFLTLYRLITTGLIGYWVCIKLYGKVRAIKKPEDDRIEVLEL